ncbi:molecular chaperone TorD family protein [Adlercreutzia sp. R25]|uniref:Molecular chaperone TorD family protein n=1 Tax=Adlercreutzia shanghongiae TaxID=3111773 RepID=A0ABU6J1E0_9ACTN|nr:MULTISPECIES: molecular chaperone TorD family protein [unclassified Adlercreutzia]MEC4271608.1 molecular chaperone TorD family protein [Adlercreutzia sp. R25]MEC4295753.1 molecular chaperone TorD family protein [Adlercreutzia sp. R22]
MEEVMSLEDLGGAEVCFAVASRLLYCEPDYEEVAEQVAMRQFSRAPFAGDNPVARKGLEEMDAWCVEVVEKARGDAAFASAGPLASEVLVDSPVFRESVDALRREWFRLFVGVGAPEASCLESFYVEPSSRMFAKNTLAVREAYRAYGLQIEHLHSEPDDHLGLMLGFVSHLIGAEGEARESTDDSVSRIVKDQEDFLVEHVLPWLAVWRYGVMKRAASDYFLGVGDFVFGLVASYAERFGIVYDAKQERFKHMES